MSSYLWSAAQVLTVGIAIWLIFDAVEMRRELRTRIREAEAFRDEYKNRIQKISKINQQAQKPGAGGLHSPTPIGSF